MSRSDNLWYIFAIVLLGIIACDHAEDYAFDHGMTTMEASNE